MTFSIVKSNNKNKKPNQKSIGRPLIKQNIPPKRRGRPPMKKTLNISNTNNNNNLENKIKKRKTKKICLIQFLIYFILKRDYKFCS